MIKWKWSRCSSREFYLLDCENLRSRTGVDFDRAFDHSIWIALFYMYVLEGEERESENLHSFCQKGRTLAKLDFETFFYKTKTKKENRRLGENNRQHDNYIPRVLTVPGLRRGSG